MVAICISGYPYIWLSVYTYRAAVLNAMQRARSLPTYGRYGGRFWDQPRARIRPLPRAWSAPPDVAPDQHEMQKFMLVERAALRSTPPRVEVPMFKCAPRNARR